MLVGKHDDAIQTLGQAVEHGFRTKGWIENDTDLDPLRDDPRFQTLLEKLR